MCERERKGRGRCFERATSAKKQKQNEGFRHCISCVSRFLSLLLEFLSLALQNEESEIRLLGARSEAKKEALNVPGIARRGGHRRSLGSLRDFVFFLFSQESERERATTSALDLFSTLDTILSKRLFSYRLEYAARPGRGGPPRCCCCSSCDRRCSSVVELVARRRRKTRSCSRRQSAVVGFIIDRRCCCLCRRHLRPRLLFRGGLELGLLCGGCRGPAQAQLQDQH